MSHKVYCIKLKKELEGLESAPYPGPFGERILKEISKEAWQMWINHQTKLINEYRLNLMDPSAKTFLREEMEKFLFGEGSELPPGYVADK